MSYTLENVVITPLASLAGLDLRSPVVQTARKNGWTVYQASFDVTVGDQRYTGKTLSTAAPDTDQVALYADIENNVDDYVRDLVTTGFEAMYLQAVRDA